MDLVMKLHRKNLAIALLAIVAFSFCLVGMEYLFGTAPIWAKLIIAVGFGWWLAGKISPWQRNTK